MSLLDNYISATKRINNYSRKELIDSVKRINAPIKKNLKTEEIRKAYLSYLKDKYLNRPRKFVAPELTVAEAFALVDSRDSLFIKNTTIAANNFINKHKLNDQQFWIFVRLIADGKMTKVGSYFISRLSMRRDLKSIIIAVDKIILGAYEHVITPEIIVKFSSRKGETNFKRVAEGVEQAKYNPNCLAALIASISPAKKAAILQKFDFLIEDKPVPKAFRDNVIESTKDSIKSLYIDQTMIEKLAKATSSKIVTYSQLGKQLSPPQPWKTFGYKAHKHVGLTINNQHASGIFDDKITSTRYVPANEVMSRQLNTVSVYADSNKDAIDIYARIDKTETGFEMVKKYNPFREGGIAEFDLNRINDYTFAFNDAAVELIRFKKEHALRPVETELLDIMRAAEHFPAGAKYQSIPEISYKYDHNSSFRTPQTSPYYMGFPSEKLTPSTVPNKPAFVAVTIEFSQRETEIQYVWDRYMGQAKDNFWVLPMSLYEFLVDNGVTLNTQYYLNTESFRDIDLMKYTKTIGNSLIGSSIAGGLKSQKPIKIMTNDQDEFDQILYEAEKNNLTFYVDFSCDCSSHCEDCEHYKQITVMVPSDFMSQLFHFHSYVLAYSATQIMAKWLEVKAANYDIIAFRSDGFVTDAPTITDLEEFGPLDLINRTPGMWKREQIQDYYRTIAITENPIRQHDFTNNTLENTKVCIGQREIKKENIIGDGGCGKSYQFLEKPAYGQIFAVPTIELRADHIRTITRDGLKHPIRNVQTAAKIFQFAMKTEKWQKYFEIMIRRKDFDRPKIIYVDEAPKFSSADWKKMIKRSKLIDCIICPIGDFKQNKNSINSAPITPEFFDNLDYDKIEYSTDGKNGTIATNHSRFTPEYRKWLDQLIADMDTLATESEKISLICDRISKDLPKKSLAKIEDLGDFRVIVGTHAVKNNMYTALKDKMISVLCKNIRTRTVEAYDPDDDRIFYGRTRMEDEMPADKILEPVTITTTDQIQGSCAKVYIHMPSLIARARRANDIGPIYTAITRGRDFSENIILA